MSAETDCCISERHAYARGRLGQRGYHRCCTVIHTLSSSSLFPDEQTNKLVISVSQLFVPPSCYMLSPSHLMGSRFIFRNVGRLMIVGNLASINCVCTAMCAAVICLRYPDVSDSRRRDKGMQIVVYHGGCAARFIVYARSPRKDGLQATGYQLPTSSQTLSLSCIKT